MISTTMRTLLLLLIRFYQRHLSPHKGFGCAYRIHTGHASCSALGYRAVRRHGVLMGLAVLRRRFYLCGVAHRRYSPPPPIHRPLRYQRGECDMGCDIGSCDSAGLDCPHIADCPSPQHACNTVSEFLDCCDCDWPRRDLRQSRENEQHVYIPPHGNISRNPT